MEEYGISVFFRVVPLGWFAYDCSDSRSTSPSTSGA